MKKFDAVTTDLKLTQAELDECCAIMRKGGTAIRNCADMLGMEYRAFRIKLFKCLSVQEVMGETDEQRKIIQDAIPSILAVRDIEWKMLCGFTRLARKLSNSWSRRSKGIQDENDYLQEALVALLDAIYSYTREDIKFITYAYWIIHNRLITAANKNRPLSPLTNEALGLLQRFDEVRSAFNRYVTEDEIYETMNLSNEELAVLKDARICVVSPADITLPQQDAGDRLNDYTEARRGIESERETVRCDYELRHAIDVAGLTSFEREVVETYMQPHYGWQEDLAKQHTNPRNGKRYSRAAINVILQRAIRKIKAVYSVATRAAV